MSRSIATIDSPEFINVKPYNPLIAECEIKVLYVGANRNRSFISKEVAAEMAHSLPGCPIVGHYKEDKGDFSDHGERIIIDDEGVKFETLTKPYGFVAPDAKVWFQKFDDTDEFGNTVQREYLMTTGYLWAGQFPEVERVITQGNNQSMELDEKSLDGKWAMNYNEEIEFFIINDAIFSKLAILGKDVEPCFEGAEITAPKVSSSFTLMDDEFKHTLFTMMQDLKDAVESRKGGLNMTNENLETKAAEEIATEFEEIAIEGEATEEVLGEVEEVPVEIEEEDLEELEEEVEEEEAESVEEEFAAPEIDVEELQAKFAALEAEVSELRKFKRLVEDEKKDALINSFYMLSDEDKADVIKNKSEYSLEEIEAKLSVICVRNKVNFDQEDRESNEDNPAVTFNLDSSVEMTPPFVQALRSVKKSD